MSPASKILLQLAALTATTLAFAQGAAAQAQTGLPEIQLTAGMYAIQTEVAATPESREIGLMYRKTMPASHGMLFVFEQKAGNCFWMKNTDLPLSIAFRPMTAPSSISRTWRRRPRTTTVRVRRCATRWR